MEIKIVGAVKLKLKGNEKLLVSFECESKRFKTKTVDVQRDRDPVWKETFSIDPGKNAKFIIFSLIDLNANTKDEVIAQCALRIYKDHKRSKTKMGLQLVDKGQKKIKKAKLKMIIKYCDLKKNGKVTKEQKTDKVCDRDQKQNGKVTKEQKTDKVCDRDQKKNDEVTKKQKIGTVCDRADGEDARDRAEDMRKTHHVNIACSPSRSQSKWIPRTIKKAFHSFDRNNDGTINKKELHKVLIHLGIEHDARSLTLLFDAVETNHDDRVDFGEFLHFMVDRKVLPPTANEGTKDRESPLTKKKSKGKDTSSAQGRADDDDDNERLNDLEVGCSVEVFSHSQKMWFPGTIKKAFSDEKGKLFVVHYGENLRKTTRINGDIRFIEKDEGEAETERDNVCDDKQIQFPDAKTRSLLEILYTERPYIHREAPSLYREQRNSWDIGIRRSLLWSKKNVITTRNICSYYGKYTFGIDYPCLKYRPCHSEFHQ